MNLQRLFSHQRMKLMITENTFVPAKTNPWYFFSLNTTRHYKTVSIGDLSTL